MNWEDNSENPVDASEKTTMTYGLMEKSELEALAISAIREHRRLLAADEEVYAEWTRASEDPTMSRSAVETLQAEYLARQKKSEAQQMELSEILDILGYIPAVSEEDLADD